MKQNVILTVMSLLSILLFSIHLTDDIVRGMSPGGLENLFAIIILVVWLYGTLVLAERRPGQIIILLASLLAAAMPVIHMKSPGVGGDFARSSGAFLFIWTLLSLGVTGTFSVILAARALRQRTAERNDEEASRLSSLRRVACMVGNENSDR